MIPAKNEPFNTDLAGISGLLLNSHQLVTSSLILFQFYDFLFFIDTPFDSLMFLNFTPDPPMELLEIVLVGLCAFGFFSLSSPLGSLKPRSGSAWVQGVALRTFSNVSISS